tara:strand:- start:306 stop:566 length:261 start_codon:yes stop_codon:yes gene_type:complete
MREVQLTGEESEKITTLNSNGIDRSAAAKQNKAPKVRSFLSKSSRININTLLSRAKQEKNNEKKGNFVLLGLAFGVIAITSVIVSL